MALSVCIPALIAQGKLTGERAERAQILYDEYVLQHEARFGRDAAESMATKQVINAMERESLNTRRQTLLQAKRQAVILFQARTRYDDGAGVDGLISGQAMLAHLVRDRKARGISNVEFRGANIRNSALTRMGEFIERHRPGLNGEVRNRAEMDDIGKAVFGDVTVGANAREIAETWRDTGEWLRQRFNAAGGAIAKRDDWGLPQSHDARLVGQVAPAQWVDDVLPALDRAKMIDNMTGEPMGDGRLRMMLGDMYEAIRSNGWSRREPGAMGTGSIGNRHAEQRILHFSDYASWSAYQNKYGGGTVYDAMMGHIERMSHDIAAIEILGPNPAATIEWMKQHVTKDAAIHGNMDQNRDTAKWGERIDQVWNEISGRNLRTESYRGALFGSALRHWQVTTKLGSAVLSATSDHATANLTRHFNGLPIMQDMGRYLKQLNPTDASDRAFARRHFIMNEELIGRLSGAGRLHMEEMFGGPLSGASKLGTRTLEKFHGFASRASDATIRVSGLNAHTIALREAIVMDFWSSATEFRGLGFDELNVGFRGFLERYGIDRASWDVVRHSPTADHGGTEWLLPENVTDQGVAERFMEGALSETAYAVPTQGLYARARLNAGGARGSLSSEFIKTGFQFKMFPMMVVGLHYQRMMGMANITSRAGYAAAYFGMMITAGALAVQLAEILALRDPMPMASGDFLRRSILKSGGAGIWGDAIKYGQGEFGSSLGNIAVGPSFQTGQTAMDVAGAVYDSAVAGDAAAREAAGHARSRAVRQLGREVPGNNLWYIRAAYERLLIDTLAGWVDPDYGSSQARMEQRARDNGNSYFLPPGQLDDARAPDMGNAFAAPPAQ